MNHHHHDERPPSHTGTIIITYTNTMMNGGSRRVASWTPGMFLIIIYSTNTFLRIDYAYKWRRLGQGRTETRRVSCPWYVFFLILTSVFSK